MSRVVLPAAVVVAPLIALAAPGQAERVLRLALVLAVAALVIDLLRSLASALPPGDAGPYGVIRPRLQPVVLPAGLAELERDVRLAGMAQLPGREPRPERIRAVAEEAARHRLARHGVSLDDPDAGAARELLGHDVWEFVTRRRATVDLPTLLSRLEAL